MIVSDPVALEAPALSDLAVSLFLPESTEVKTLHVLAMQTNYASQTWDATGTSRPPRAEQPSSHSAPRSRMEMELSPIAMDVGLTCWRSDCRKVPAGKWN